jgi:hypothetical protein
MKRNKEWKGEQMLVRKLKKLLKTVLIQRRPMKLMLSIKPRLMLVILHNLRKERIHLNLRSSTRGTSFSTGTRKILKS